MKKVASLLVLLMLCISMLNGQQTVGLFLNDSSAFNGYTLFAPNNSRNTYLIDNCGHLINEWNTSNTTPGLSVYLLEDGRLIRTGRINGSFNAGGRGGRVDILSWEGDLLWRYELATAINHLHHDVEYLPNGNILVLAWDEISESEAESLGRQPNTVSSQGLWLEKVMEIMPGPNNEATVVWEWRLYDHLIQDFDSTKVNYGVVADHPELLDINFNAGSGGVGPGGVITDWVHFNSVDYNPELDQILLSSRSLSEIYIIDHSTTTSEATGHTGGNSGKGGDLLYRWGNPQAYGRGTVSDRQLFGQHDANWTLPGYPNEGKIMIFNNGSGRPAGSYSTVELIDPPLENGVYQIDSILPFGPELPAWNYTADPPNSFFSTNISGASLLPNGNALICEGTSGRFFEVDSAGTILWEYINPVTASGPVNQGANLMNNAVFRVYRYGTDYPGFIGKDLQPGPPVELNPLPDDCMIYDGSVPAFTLAAPEGVRLLQNPVSDVLTIINEEGKRLQFVLNDITGKVVLDESGNDVMVSLSIPEFRPGMYILRVKELNSPAMAIWKVIVQK